MRSLLKKTEGKSTKSAPSIAWHPDFRDVATLPDIKTVRTKFFVNSIAIGLLLALVMYVSYREVRLVGLHSQLEKLNSDIESLKVSSSKVIAAQATYQAEEAAFTVAQGILKKTFSYPDFVMHLGSIMPDGIRLTRIEYRGLVSPLIVSGSVKGLDASANDSIGLFVKKIQSDDQVKNIFSEVILNDTLSRNVSEGVINFELSFRFKK